MTFPTAWQPKRSRSPQSPERRRRVDSFRRNIEKPPGSMAGRPGKTRSYPLFGFYRHDALHDRKVSGKRTDERIFARRRSSESNFIRFTTTQHLRMGDDLLLGLIVFRDVSVVFGWRALCGKRWHRCLRASKSQHCDPWRRPVSCPMCLKEGTTV